jgi:hypothetical protein
MSSSNSYSSGSGATHTVWVAPTQGVLRYVPFALNASVGDTVKFVWGANNHTVTKSSALDLCNKTSSAPFASGEQNKTFVCKNQSKSFVSLWKLIIFPPFFFILFKKSKSPRSSTILTPLSTTAELPPTAKRACSVSSTPLMPLARPAPL